MDNKQKWSEFTKPSDEDLKNLKKYITVDPLLVSKSIVDDSEYRIYYNDEDNNLQYIYVGTNQGEKQKELIQNLKNSPEFVEMVEDIVAKYLESKLGLIEKLTPFEEYKIKLTSKPNPIWNTVENTFAKDLFDINDKARLEAFAEINLDIERYPNDTDEVIHNRRLIFKNNYLIDTQTLSQCTYYFDCGNGSKGSFASLLEKDSKYYILTAAHNLQNGLIKKEEAFKDKLVSGYYLCGVEEIELELINYDKDVDWAILEISNITKEEKNILIEDSLFYKNTYRGDIGELKKDQKGKLLGFISKVEEGIISTRSKKKVVFKDNELNEVAIGKSGDSGGLVIQDNYLLGMYLENMSPTGSEDSYSIFISFDKINISEYKTV